MKKLLFSTIALVICFYSLSKCSKKECFTPPPPFQLRVEDTLGADLLNPAVCPTLKLYYLENGSANEVELAINLLYKTDAISDKKTFYLQCIDLPWKSLEGLTVFKLYRSNLDADTLTVEVQKTTSCNCTYHSTSSVLFNGKDIKNQYDTSIDAFIAKIQ